MTVVKCCPKCIRKNSRSKYLYWTASWKVVRESYHQKGHYWKSAQNFFLKNCGSKCLYWTASWKNVRESYHQNWQFWRLPETVSAKTVHQNVRTGILAGKVSKKTTVKMPVLKCCLKNFRENSRSKCPYQNSSWNSVRKTITENDVLKSCPKLCPKNQWFKMSVRKC